MVIFKLSKQSYSHLYVTYTFIMMSFNFITFLAELLPSNLTYGLGFVFAFVCFLILKMNFIPTQYNLLVMMMFHLTRAGS